MTLRTEPLDIKARATITGQTLKINVEEIALKLEKIYNSTIGNVTDEEINAVLTIVGPVIKTAINIVTDTKGIELDFLLDIVGLTLLEFGPTTLQPKDGFVLIFTTIIPHLSGITPIKYHGDFVQQMLGPDKKITISDENIKDFVNPGWKDQI